MALQTSAQSRGLRIFIVEDNDDTRAMLSQLIQVMGYDVGSAGSVSEAIRKLPEADPDVIISDIGLPDGDGLDLMRQLPLSHPVYAIAMSGYGTLADRERSAAVGFRHHLVKPMDVDKLESLLAEASRECAAARAMT